MIISEEQFFTYMSCPVKYDLIFNHKIRINTVDIKDLLQKTIKAFYSEMIMNKKVMSFNQLSKKFESIIKPHHDVIDNNTITKALFLLRNFYNWAHDNTLFVCSVNENYLITFGDASLEGVLSPIAYMNDDSDEVIRINFGQRQYDQTAFEMSLKNSIDTLAYRSIYDRSLAGIKMHHAKSGKDILAYAGANEINRFEKSLKAVVSGIKNNIYFPKESFECERCLYKNLCRGWGI